MRLSCYARSCGSYLSSLLELSQKNSAGRETVENGLSVNYSYDYSQRINVIAIQTDLKKFVETLKVEAKR